MLNVGFKHEAAETKLGAAPVPGSRYWYTGLPEFGSIISFPLIECSTVPEPTKFGRSIRVPSLLESLEPSNRPTGAPVFQETMLFTVQPPRKRLPWKTG